MELLVPILGHLYELVPLVVGWALSEVELDSFVGRLPLWGIDPSCPQVAGWITSAPPRVSPLRRYRTLGAESSGGVSITCPWYSGLGWCTPGDGVGFCDLCPWDFPA